MNISEPSQMQSGIAIIGMACIFPGAPDLRSYWRNIVSKVDAVCDPPDDWGADIYYDPNSTENDRVYCKRGGYLGDLAVFDPLEYGVMPSSIDGGEPDHFLALRMAHEALADAGYRGDSERPLAGERVEVILGRGAYINRGFTNLVQHGLIVDQTLRLLKQLHPEHTLDELARIRQELIASLPPLNAEMAPGLVPNILSGRIANRLDLMGPNFTIDAACASSLIAVDRGVQDLLTGRCNVALVGGIHCSTPAPIFMVFCQLNALSRRGWIQPFSEDADGTLLGEGLGMMVLKRTADARRDGDRIYAVIKAVGTASDGRALGLLTPRVEGEELAMRRAYEACGVEPSTVGLLEAHGTGTAVGDQTEAEALARVFGLRNGQPPSCALGSVKSMISHLIPAAGIAGMIKAALALYYKVLPPTIHCERPDPKLALERTPLYINTETRPWIHGRASPRRAGVNAFGFGGINAHAILEEFIPDDPAPAPDGGPPWDSEVVLFRASSRAELVETCERMGNLFFAFNGQAPDLRDIAYTLNCPLTPAGQPAWCLAVVASSVEDLKRKLAHAIQRLKEPACRKINDIAGTYFFERAQAREGKMAFLFPGEGSQYVNMLADLCLRLAPVREKFDLIDRAFAAHTRNWLPSQVVFPPPLPNDPETRRAQEERLAEMDFGAEAVFAATQGILALLTELGIRPQAVVGHSGGEISALLAAGVIQVTDDAQLVRHIVEINSLYGQLSSQGLIPVGRAVAVSGVEREVVMNVLGSSSGDVHLAIDNCPNQVVVCGPESSVNRAVERLRAAGGICTPLAFQRPYHTPAFERYCAQVRPFFDRLDICPARVTAWCAGTAQPFPDAIDEIRQLASLQPSLPVRFRETLEAMHDSGVSIFVEVGPKGGLTPFVGDTLRGRPHVAIASDLAGTSGVLQLNHLLGRLAAHGVDMQLNPLYERRAIRRIVRDRAEAAIRGAEHTLRRPMRLATGLTHLSLQDQPVANARTLPVESTSVPVLPAAPTMAASAPFLSTVSRTSVMDAYLSSMDQFLSVQQEVIRAYLGGPHPPQAPNGNGAPRSGTSTNGDSAQGDGIAGSIAPAQVSVAALDPHAKPASGKLGLATCLVNVIGERTGYPSEVLNLDLNLEADLGIDSIKRIEILGAVHRQTGLIGPDRMERVSALKTIRQILDFLSETPAGAAPLIANIESLRSGQEVVALCELNTANDLFLNDHALGGHVSVTDPTLTGLPLIPLTMTVEMMAEVGAALLPGKTLIEMRSIRGLQWLGLDEGRLTLRITGRFIAGTQKPGESPPEESQVHIRIALTDGTLVAEAIAIFANRHPDPPKAVDLVLSSARPSKWTQSRLYRDHMFHGPSFRGIESIERWGENGYEATLRGLPASALFRAVPSPKFLADPILLDAAGQMVGYWAAEHLSTMFNVFPFGIESVQLYRPPLKDGERVACQARIALVGDSQIHADLDVVGVDGRIVLRVAGWQDLRVDFPDSFYRMCISPHGVMISAPWTPPLAPSAPPCSVRCCILETTSLPSLAAHGAIWLRALAQLVLSRHERKVWRDMKGSERRRIDWLLGRCCAKDAVRLLQRELLPADVEILSDENGRPVISTILSGRNRPTVSIAHAEGLAIAVAADLPDTDGPGIAAGIDVQRMDPARDAFEDIPFSQDERALLASCAAGSPTDRQRDREYALRLLCAKQAAAKALGYRRLGEPDGIMVRAIGNGAEIISLEVAGALAELLPHLRGVPLTACSTRQGGLVVATCLLRDIWRKS
jgi:acyl transferase domain-containing protein/phosphopantetheinyl transferase/acyl carrier protein